MNTLTRRLGTAAAAASALALIPLAAPGARAGTAPDPCATPMVFTGVGTDTSHTAHPSHRALGPRHPPCR